MLIVDDRAGSKELIHPLRRLGLDIEAARLDFGDLAWEGRGLKGQTVSIGVEFKHLRELVQALRTERLQGFQLPGMRQTYDHSYLLIEGEWLYDRKGQLLRRKNRRTITLEGQMSVQELLKRKHVLHLCGGLNPITTLTREDTLQEILALYHTWTDVDLDKHKSHLAIYSAPPLIPISDFRGAVKQFPGVGMRMSLAVEKHFKGSLRKAVLAGPDEWADLETVDDEGKRRHFGMKNALKVVAFCKGVS